MNYFNKNKWWSIAVAVLLIANIITLVFFWLIRTDTINPPAPPPPPGANPATAFLIKELGFSTSQQQQYEQLFREHQQQVRAIRDSIRMSKDGFFELLNNDSVSDKTLQDQAEKSSKLQQQLDLLTFNHFKEVKAICNPSQQDKFKDVIQKVVRQMAPPPPPQPGRPPREKDGFREPPPPNN
jgi:periplasmic protein CpxP/Spy